MASSLYHGRPLTFWSTVSLSELPNASFRRSVAPSKFTVRHCGILGHFWPGMKAATYRPKLFGFVRIDGRYIVWHFLFEAKDVK